MAGYHRLTLRGFLLLYLDRMGADVDEAEGSNSRFGWTYQLNNYVGRYPCCLINALAFL